MPTIGPSRRAGDADRTRISAWEAGQRNLCVPDYASDGGRRAPPQPPPYLYLGTQMARSRCSVHFPRPCQRTRSRTRNDPPGTRSAQVPWAAPVGTASSGLYETSGSASLAVQRPLAALRPPAGARISTPAAQKRAGAPRGTGAPKRRLMAEGSHMRDSTPFWAGWREGAAG